MKSATGETRAAAAARAEFATDLGGMTDDDIARELADRQRELEELEPWIEALTAERAHRAAKTAPPSPQIDLVDYLAEHPA